MISSASVWATNASRPWRMLSGDPITVQAWTSWSRARSGGVSWLSKLSTGGGKRLGWPRRKLSVDCCAELCRYRASAAVAAAKTFTPTITYGVASCSEG